jgi:hypothetical protein
MILAYVVYQKNKGQGRHCFLSFFRPTNSKKFFKYFLRLKIHKLIRFHEKKIKCGFKPVILSTLKGTCSSTV